MELREKGFSLTNTEEADKMAEELLALKDQIDKDVEAEKAVLQDKELTTEVAEGIPFKLEGQAKIVKVADLDRVDLECAGEFTEGGDLKADEFDYTKLVVVAYDKGKANPYMQVAVSSMMSARIRLRAHGLMRLVSKARWNMLRDLRTTTTSSGQTSENLSSCRKALRLTSRLWSN